MRRWFISRNVWAYVHWNKCFSWLVFVMFVNIITILQRNSTIRVFRYNRASILYSQKWNTPVKYKHIIQLSYSTFIRVNHYHYDYVYYKCCSDFCFKNYNKWHAYICIMLSRFRFVQLYLSVYYIINIVIIDIFKYVQW